MVESPSSVSEQFVEKWPIYKSVRIFCEVTNWFMSRVLGLVPTVPFSQLQKATGGAHPHMSKSAIKALAPLARSSPARVPLVVDAFVLSTTHRNSLSYTCVWRHSYRTKKNTGNFPFPSLLCLQKLRIVWKQRFRSFESFLAALGVALLEFGALVKVVESGYPKCRRIQKDACEPLQYSDTACFQYTTPRPDLICGKKKGYVAFSRWRYDGHSRIHEKFTDLYFVQFPRG